MKNKTLPYILSISALSVSSSAAFYSVTGLSKLFAGASTAVIIMASSLEVAKLVIASFLYQYWKQLSKVLKTYLVIATSILVLITSVGIYGFLTNAYQITKNKYDLLSTKTDSLVNQQTFFKSKLAILEKQVDQKQKQISTNLVNNNNNNTRSQISTNRLNNTIISQNNKINKDVDNLNKIILQTQDSISLLETLIKQSEISNSSSSELGPLQYLSTLTNRSMDQIINWFILIIIFVFDPLAISLVVSANIAFNKMVEQPVNTPVSSYPPPSPPTPEPTNTPVKNYEENNITENVTIDPAPIYQSVNQYPEVYYNNRLENNNKPNDNTITYME